MEFIEHDQRALLDRIDDIERSIVERIARLETAIAKGIPLFQIFNDGMAAHRTALLAVSPLSEAAQIRLQWAERIRLDSELRFPHRKLLDALLGHFDFQQQKFQEVQFSRLVRESRTGKGNAKEYLRFLERKAYVAKRTDGYRIFFRLADTVPV